MSRARNPYVAGAPLRRKEDFFGRQDILRWAERELYNPATNGLVIFGQRRIGRTSLLLQLQRTLPAGAFLPVYFDLLGQTTCPVGQVLADLADTVAWQAGLEFPDPEAFNNRGRFFRRQFLPNLYQALGENRRPVFLLDEFEVLDQATETELPEKAATEVLLPLLRRIMTQDPRPAFVFAVGRRLEDLPLGFTAIFKDALVREVWVLDQESAEALVRQAEANDTLCFTGEAVARILSLTSGHPFFTQLLCQRVWERAYAARPSALPRIDVPEVEAVVPEALEAGDQALVWLWNGLGPVEKICAAALAEVTGEEEIISESRVIQVLADYSIHLPRGEMRAAPRDLVKRRVLEQVGEHRYRFAIELIRHWIRQTKPVCDVKDELGRLAPAPLPPALVEAPAPGSQIGRYEIEAELGSGAMGIVYKAYDPNVGRFVALKVLRPIISGPRTGELEQRFRREAQAAGKLEHPNIVMVYDADVASGQWYIAMEYLEGKTLAEVVTQAGTRSLEWVTDIVTQTCDALNYAHEHQVVHRDIKPSNIMVLENGRVKVADFGLASVAAASDLTRSGVFLGTPRYMSPEQIRDPKHVDGRSDIFSLGAVVYEILTGELLFPGDHITPIYHITGPEAVNLSKLSVDLPDAIRQVLEKALAKDANERFSTCAEFSEAFVRAAEAQAQRKEG